jgi:hypothetical protein
MEINDLRKLDPRQAKPRETSILIKSWSKSADPPGAAAPENPGEGGWPLSLP